MCHALIYSVLFFYLFKLLVTTHYGEGDGTLLHYSCPENPMDRGAW